MTREEAIKEIEKAFEPAFANYIITALIEGATVSDIQHRWGQAYEAGVKDGLEQEPCEDVVSRAEVRKIAKEMFLEVANMELDVKTISDCISCASSKCREVLESKLQALPSVKQQEPRKGHWIVNKWGNISCSECGCNALYDKVYTDSPLFGKAIRIKSTFCPTCGADMREVKE